MKSLLLNKGIVIEAPQAVNKEARGIPLEMPETDALAPDGRHLAAAQRDGITLILRLPTAPGR
jgi:hypothetical protein